MPIVLFVTGLVASLVVPSGTRALGSLRVSAVGLGTLNLPIGEEQPPAAAEALLAAIKAGCNFVDTAEACEARM